MIGSGKSFISFPVNLYCIGSLNFFLFFIHEIITNTMNLSSDKGDDLNENVLLIGTINDGSMHKSARDLTAFSVGSLRRLHIICANWFHKKGVIFMCPYI